MTGHRSAGILLALSLLGFGGAASAGTDADSLFEKGNGAFRESRYGDAIDEWESIRKGGLESGPLLYNLGVAYYKEDDLGRAISRFQRAKRFLPRDRDLRSNLALVQSRTLDRSIHTERFPLLRVAANIAGRLSLSEWILALEAFYALLLLGGAVWLLSPGRRDRVRTPLQVAAFLFLAASLFSGMVFHDQKVVRRAAILPGEAAIRSGPGDSYTDEFLLHQGTVVRTHRSAEGWTLIEVTPDLKGWIRNEALERI